MTKRYRIIEHQDCFGLHEVRYTDEGSIASYNREAVFLWEKDGSMRTDSMLAAAGLPILPCENLPCAQWTRSSFPRRGRSSYRDALEDRTADA